MARKVSIARAYHVFNAGRRWFTVHLFVRSVFDGGSLHLDPDADDFGGPSVSAAKFARETRKLYRDQAQLKKAAGAWAYSIRLMLQRPLKQSVTKASLSR